MTINVTEEKQLNQGIELKMFDTYFFIDLNGEIENKIFKNDIEDRQNLDTYKIFKNIKDAADYMNFWNDTEAMAKFRMTKPKMYTIICDPKTYEIGIAIVEKEYPNFIYFESYEEALNYCDRVGTGNIKKYLYNI